MQKEKKLHTDQLIEEELHNENRYNYAGLTFPKQPISQYSDEDDDPYKDIPVPNGYRFFDEPDPYYNMHPDMFKSDYVEEEDPYKDIPKPKGWVDTESDKPQR